VDYSSISEGKFLNVRAWHVVAALICLIAVITSIWLMKANSGSDANQIALRESLTRLSASISQGVSLSAYGQLVLDARTKFEMARGGLTAEQVANCNEALDAAKSSVLLWTSIIQDESATQLWSDVFLYSEQLGIAHSKADFKKLTSDILKDWKSDYARDWNMGEMKNYIRKNVVTQALFIVDLRLGLATKSLS
jgi:hypothetical protein